MNEEIRQWLTDNIDELISIFHEWLSDPYISADIEEIKEELILKKWINKI